MFLADDFKAAVQMSDAVKTAIPDANYVIAVKLPSTDKGPYEVTVHVRDLKIRKTDLRIDAVAKGGEQLVPQPDELLVLMTPDGVMSYCTSTPRWRWI